jgi:hypothetical protein
VINKRLSKDGHKAETKEQDHKLRQGLKCPNLVNTLETFSDNSYFIFVTENVSEYKSLEQVFEA